MTQGRSRYEMQAYPTCEPNMNRWEWSVQGMKQMWHFYQYCPGKGDFGLAGMSRVTRQANFSMEQG